MKECIIVFKLFLLVLALAPASYAEEQYQTEIATTYRRFDSWDNKILTIFGTELMDNRTVAYGVTGEIFFAPVNTAGHLLAEAAFLERAGSALVSFEQVETSGKFEGTGPELHSVVNYARPGSQLVVQASYDESKINYTAGRSGQVKINSYGIKIGDYFTNRLIAGIGFDRTKTIDSSAPISPFIIKNPDVLSCQLYIKYVREFEGGRGVKIEGKEVAFKAKNSTENGSVGGIISMSISYYWSQAMSTGIGFQQANNSDAMSPPPGQTYTASADYFISPRFSIKGVYDRFMASSRNLAGDSNAYNITLTARF